jgi:hypothetical protein
MVLDDMPKDTDVHMRFRAHVNMDFHTNEELPDEEA